LPVAAAGWPASANPAETHTSQFSERWQVGAPGSTNRITNSLICEYLHGHFAEAIFDLSDSTFAHIRRAGDRYRCCRPSRGRRWLPPGLRVAREGAVGGPPALYSAPGRRRPVARKIPQRPVAKTGFARTPPAAARISTRDPQPAHANHAAFHALARHYGRIQRTARYGGASLSPFAQSSCYSQYLMTVR
jgi:hypothetical protein